MLKPPQPYGPLQDQRFHKSTLFTLEHVCVCVLVQVSMRVAPDADRNDSIVADRVSDKRKPLSVIVVLAR